MCEGYLAQRPKDVYLYIEKNTDSYVCMYVCMTLHIRGREAPPFLMFGKLHNLPPHPFVYVCTCKWHY